MHQSIPNTNIPPPSKPLVKFFVVVKSPAPGKIFWFWKIWSAFSVAGGRNFGILQKSNLKKKWKAPSHTMFKVLKFPPPILKQILKQESNNRWVQFNSRSVWIRKVPSYGINWQLRTLIIYSKSDPRQPLGDHQRTAKQFRWHGIQAESWRKTLGVARGHCWHMELTNALYKVC